MAVYRVQRAMPYGTQSTSWGRPSGLQHSLRSWGQLSPGFKLERPGSLESGRFFMSFYNEISTRVV